MGKKGTKRKTRWRVLPIGEDGGGNGSGNDDDVGVVGNEADCPTGTYARATQSARGQGVRRAPTGRPYNKPQQYNNYHPRSYHSHQSHDLSSGQPLVTTEKQIFNEEEYTKITTPRQDVLFKKGYLGRKKAVVVDQDTPAPSVAHYNNDGTHHEEMLENDPNEMCEEQPQFIYTNGFVDQTGVYYINGSGYEMYDPYTGNITVLVGPHYPSNGGPPVLAAVPCQPVPLQPLEWFNPPGFLPFVAAPCHNRDRRKRYSTDSQNCSPQSSESTGPPGSPQESDEVAVADAPAARHMYPPSCPQAPPGYVYPGYMFGAPMYNMNGVTVQSTPHQAPCSDIASLKRRKKKRRRRRKRNGAEDGSEESSSDEKEADDDLLSPTGHESSLESDSKLSLSSGDQPIAARETAVHVSPVHQQDVVESPAHQQLVAQQHTVYQQGVIESPVHQQFVAQQHTVYQQGVIESPVHQQFVAQQHSAHQQPDCNPTVNHQATLESPVSQVIANELAVQTHLNGHDIVEKNIHNQAVQKPVISEVILQEEVKLINVEPKAVNGSTKLTNGVSKSVNGESKLNSGSKNFVNGEIKTANGIGKLVNGESKLVNGVSKPSIGDKKLVNKLINLNCENKLTNGIGKLTNGDIKPPNDQDKLVNGHDKSSPVICNGNVIVATADTDASFESYEDILNSFIKEELEDEWITVKGKGSQGKKTGELTNGPVRYPAELTNGHAKPYKEYKRDDYGKVNGVKRPQKDKKEPKFKTVEIKGKGRMDGNEKDSKSVVPKVADEPERKLSSSSSDSSRDTPAKPIRGERKSQKNNSPRKSPEIVVAAPAMLLRPEALAKPVADEPKVESRKEVAPLEQVPADKLPDVQSLKDLSTKSIPPDLSAPVESRATIQLPVESPIEITAEFLRKEVEHKEYEDPNDQNTLLRESEDVAPPVAPPRRKKTWRQARKRSPSPAAAEESSSSSSQESVIECLSSGINSPDAGNDTPGLSSEEDEVIYTGKLGITEPEIIGILKLTKDTIQVHDDTVLNPVVEEPPTDAPQDDGDAHLLNVQQAAAELVDSVISASLEETSQAQLPETSEATQDKETEIPTQLGITDAVTRWLRSQSPDVLSCPIEDSTASESEEDENELGSKNSQRNPLRVPSVNDDEASRRVANKSTEQCNNNNNEEEEDNESIEWDYHYDNVDKADPLDHILRHAPISPENDGTPTIAPEYINLPEEVQSKYDPLANDTFASVESTLLDRIDSCAEMCDPSVSVAKYYVLGPQPEKSPEMTLANELAQLEQPLPESWVVAPLKCHCDKDKSGKNAKKLTTESGGIFKRKYGGRLNGDGNPFPCGGVCCIVQ